MKLSDEALAELIVQEIHILRAKLASDKLAAEGYEGSPIISSSAELIRYLRSTLNASSSLTCEAPKE